jgi:xylose isomerase
MANQMKFALSLGIFAPCADRFVTGGYHQPLTFEEMIAKASKVKDADGMEMDYPFMEPAIKDASIVKKILKKYGMKLCTIEIDHYSHPKWKFGALTSEDKMIRREAVVISKEGMDAAAELGAEQINLWLGHDGYDYPMEADYAAYWDRTIDGIQEIAEYRKDIKVCIEYKPKEPRAHSLVSSAAKSLIVANTIGLKNVGVNLDTGHALMGAETLAESAVLCHRFGKLFYLHWNDNYREWDHDMTVGSVHLWETLELLYWLNKIGYKGWHTLDIYPYRQDGIDASEESIRTLKKLMVIVTKMDEKKLSAMRSANDTAGITTYLKNVTLK